MLDRWTFSRGIKREGRCCAGAPLVPLLLLKMPSLLNPTAPLVCVCGVGAPSLFRSLLLSIQLEFPKP